MDKNLKYKLGSIEVLFLCCIFIFFMSIFFYVFYLNSKINITVFRIKQDIYNIVQNAILSFDREELSYNNYIINENEMINRVSKIINLSYKEATLKYLNYNKEDNEINVIISINVDSKNKIDINQNIKIKLMQIDSYDK